MCYVVFQSHCFLQETILHNLYWFSIQFNLHPRPVHLFNSFICSTRYDLVFFIVCLHRCHIHCETTAGEIFRKEERVVDGIP